MPLPAGGLSWPPRASRRCRNLRAACHGPQGPPGDAAAYGQPVMPPKSLLSWPEGPRGEAATCGPSCEGSRSTLPAIPLNPLGLNDTEFTQQYPLNGNKNHQIFLNSHNKGTKLTMKLMLLVLL